MNRCAMRGAVLACIVACSEEHDPHSQADASVQGEADASQAQSGGGLPGAGPGGAVSPLGPTGGSTGGAGVVSMAPPPGCNDNAPRTQAWIVDDQTFVISDAQQACGAPARAASRAAGDCAHLQQYVTFRVPTLRVSGTYQVGRDAAMVIERKFPIEASAAGCTCLPSIDTPQTLASGTLAIEVFDDGAVGATIELEQSKQGILIQQRCPRQ